MPIVNLPKNPGAGNSQDPRVNPTAILSLKRHSIKCFWNSYLHPHRLMWLSNLIWEVSLYSGEQVRHKHTAGQSAENKCLWRAQPHMGHLCDPTPLFSENTAFWREWWSSKGKGNHVLEGSNPSRLPWEGARDLGTLGKLGLAFCRSEVILPWSWRKAEFHLGAHKKIDLLPTDERFLAALTFKWKCERCYSAVGVWYTPRPAIHRVLVWAVRKLLAKNLTRKH